MPAAIVDIGKTSIRDRLKPNTGLPTTGLVTHVAVSDDTTAFSAAHTTINPAVGTTSTHAEPATSTDVDATTFDATITITGTTEFTGKVINTISLTKGVAARSASSGTHTGAPLTAGTTDLLTRSVRGSGLGIGVQAGDTFTVGVRVAVQDNS